MEQSATLEKALDVLFHLHAAGVARGTSDVGRAMRMPKTTAHRLLGSLARRGFVERDERGRWRPGIALVALGLGVLEREPVVEAARPVLEEAAEQLGETFFLVGARGGRLFVLDKAEGAGFLRASPRVGTELPAHATAVGRLYLALAPEAVTLPAGPLERFTPHTRVARDALAREVARIRARGWAENRDEWIEGLCAVAAPVRAGDRLVAVLALAGPAARVQTGERSRSVRAALRAAARVSARLEGRST
jgi:DNA-binding IclR family transcriptional regulator